MVVSVISSYLLSAICLFNSFLVRAYPISCNYGYITRVLCNYLHRFHVFLFSLIKLLRTFFLTSSCICFCSILKSFIFHLHLPALLFWLFVFSFTILLLLICHVHTTHIKFCIALNIFTTNARLHSLIIGTLMYRTLPYYSDT